MPRKSDSLLYGVGRASLSGPKSHQYRIRQNAKAFAKMLRQCGLGVQQWNKITNKHFQRTADHMMAQGIGAGRIAEVFSAARHLCRAYGNQRISRRNGAFGIRRGSIANQQSRAANPKVIKDILSKIASDPYEHAARCAAQIRLQYELGLRREEAAKLDLQNDWDRESRTLQVRYGTKGGRPRVLEHLSDEQAKALEEALPFVSRSNRPGIFNLMPEGMGDNWQHSLSYMAAKYGLTKKGVGFTLHGNRHERFHQMYVDRTGFEPPNQHPSPQAFREAAEKVAGERWPELDADARDAIETTAGHSAGRRDVSNAYLGSGK